MDFTSDPLSFAAAGCLLLSVLSIWIFQNSRIWLVFWASSMPLAYSSGRIDFVGLMGELGFGSLCYLYYSSKIKKSAFFQFIVGTGIFVIGLLLAFHKMPGFNNWLLASQWMFTKDAVPIHFYLNFDKPLIAVFLIGFSPTLCRSLKEAKSLFKQVFPIFLIAFISLLGSVWVLNYTRLDFKWFNYTLLWLAFHLVFTCIAEEALFRGFLQRELTRILGGKNFGSLCSWWLVSVLFGALHFNGGPAFVFLATLGGLCYGYAYLKTQRIEASIGVHFGVNALHFIFFTYPALNTIHH